MRLLKKMLNKEYGFKKQMNCEAGWNPDKIFAFFFSKESKGETLKTLNDFLSYHSKKKEAFKNKLNELMEKEIPEKDIENLSGSLREWVISRKDIIMKKVKGTVKEDYAKFVDNFLTDLEEKEEVSKYTYFKSARKQKRD